MPDSNAVKLLRGAIKMSQLLGADVLVSETESSQSVTWQNSGGDVQALLMLDDKGLRMTWMHDMSHGEVVTLRHIADELGVGV